MKEESDDLSGMASSHTSFDDILGSHGSPLSHPLSSPSGLSPSSPLSFPNMPSYTIPNAVHMEVQDNAKLPTFNLPVDRSNSTSRNRSASLGCDPATASALDEMIRLSENDINLTELFLTSDKRSNASMAYSGASDLHTTLGNTEKERSFSLGSNGFNELLSIKSPPSSPTSSLPPPSAGTPTDLNATPTKFNSYYPQERRFPLPIPTKEKLPLPSVPSPTKGLGGDPLAVAISTAAAIASRQDSTPSAPPAVPSVSSVLNKAGGALEISLPAGGEAPGRSGPTTYLPTQSINGNSILAPKTAQQTSAKTSTPAISTTASSFTTDTTIQSATTPAKLPAIPSASAPAPSSTFYNRQSRPAQASHAAAHATSPASIKDATKRRSQFGFGGNHVVPSVPLPPPKSRSPKKAARVVGVKHTITAQFPPTGAAAAINACAAYERKKQRAKDARVKLNDSIERLSIAINLVGTQSKQRAAQMSGMDFTTDTPKKLADLGRAAQQAMEDCQATSKAAQKWDRPSFVGTAASLLQGLNSQCDALMRVTMEMKLQMEQNRKLQIEGGDKRSANVVPVLNGDLNNPTLSTRPDAEKKEGALSRTKHAMFGDADSASVPTKRQKTNCVDDVIPTIMGNPSAVSDEGPSHQTDSGLLSHPPIVKAVSSFLDPRSLSRCLVVSKEWRSRKLLQNEETWRRLALQRYGVVAVRGWELNESEDSVTPIPAAPLYKTMDAANVKPHCLQEGNIFLGSGKIQGVASAWVSLVERSNGETARSVRLSQGPNDVGQYKSLPVVEMRILIQNTGVTNDALLIKEQAITVDASTRRRGEELQEIESDDRFKKAVVNPDGSEYVSADRSDLVDIVVDLCCLRLFESVVLVTHIHAKGCATTSKFKTRANFTKVVLTLNGTAIPLVVPFERVKVT